MVARHRDKRTLYLAHSLTMPPHPARIAESVEPKKVTDDRYERLENTVVFVVVVVVQDIYPLWHSVHLASLPLAALFQAIVPVAGIIVRRFPCALYVLFQQCA